jgi:ABC-type phosphate transport system permease subunit
MPAQQQYGTALILLILVLSLNVSATLIRSYFRRRRQW